MSERDRKTEIVCVNGKEREKERERDSTCVCVKERERKRCNLFAVEIVLVSVRER